MRTIRAMLWTLALAAGHALAQPATMEASDATAPPSPILNEKSWSFSVSAYTYIVPDDDVYVQPTVTADRDWLHLEARYNYESRNTGSLWAGYNLSFGDKLVLDFTPMIGGVFGDTTGVAPGYRFSLSYWKLELSSEGEFLFDCGDSADNFFYTWSELSFSPTDWFRVGVAIQRTKLYQSDFDFQRGFLVGFTYKKVDFTAYIFDPDASRPTVVLGVTLNF